MGAALVAEALRREIAEQLAAATAASDGGGLSARGRSRSLSPCHPARSRHTSRSHLSSPEGQPLLRPAANGDGAPPQSSPEAPLFPGLRRAGSGTAPSKRCLHPAGAWPHRAAAPATATSRHQRHAARAGASGAAAAAARRRGPPRIGGRVAQYMHYPICTPTPFVFIRIPHLSVLPGLCTDVAHMLHRNGSRLGQEGGQRNGEGREEEAVQHEGSLSKGSAGKGRSLGAERECKTSVMSHIGRWGGKALTHHC